MGPATLRCRGHLRFHHALRFCGSDRASLQEPPLPDLMRRIHQDHAIKFALETCLEQQWLVVPDQELVELKVEVGKVRADSKDVIRNLIGACHIGLSFLLVTCWANNPFLCRMCNELRSRYT